MINTQNQVVLHLKHCRFICLLRTRCYLLEISCNFCGQTQPVVKAKFIIIIGILQLVLLFAVELAAAEQDQSQGILWAGGGRSRALPRPPADRGSSCEMRSGCSGLHPDQPWNLQGWRQHSLSAPLFRRLAILMRKIFFLVSGWNLSRQFIAVVWVTVSSLQLNYYNWCYSHQGLLEC